MRHSNTQGFTLLELMIVMAIIGILASVATSFYGDNVISSKRTEAREAILNMAATLEKCKAVYGSYNSANCSVKTSDTLVTETGLYEITVTSAASTFSLSAKPETGTSQANDKYCTELTLNHLGIEDGVGTDKSKCWK